MDQICFRRDTFYLVVSIGVIIIGFVLYQTYRGETGSYRRQLREVTAQLRQEIDRDFQPRKTMENQEKSQKLSEYIMANLIQRAHEYPSSRDLNRAMNPLVSPMRRNPYYLEPTTIGLPVNVPTRGEMGPFAQMGYLYLGGKSKIMMPLYGRRAYGNKYDYYTSHHENTQVKIPVKVKGSEELSDGDSLNLPGYKGSFTVKLYEYDYPRYLP